MGILNKKPSKFDPKKPHQFLDGYAEGPLSHFKGASATNKETEYFMQWIHPIKLHRIAIRTPMGYRCTHGLAEDVWNNNLALKELIRKDGLELLDKEAETINFGLQDYMKSRNWFYEMEKFTGFVKEQGEAILVLYCADMENPYDMERPVDFNEEILEVEAINVVDYNIELWDTYGDPEWYRVYIDRYATQKGSYVRIHPSRILRYVDKNIDSRERGHSLLSVIYDMIVILTNIVKSGGEAAFRWGTGHPLILTKDLMDQTSVDKLQKIIGDPTRRSAHMLPSEHIESFSMIGQAGQMLNLRSLADMTIDQITTATAIPRPILLGEVAGVVTGSEVNERSYFALLDKNHTDLEPFVRIYFARDINIRKLLWDYGHWNIDWGLREVLSKSDQIEYDQKKTSNALALTAICTVDECRGKVDMPAIGPEAGGDVIFGLMPFLMAPEENESRESAKGTDKQKTSTAKDLEKDKSLGVKNLKDAFELMRTDIGVEQSCKLLGIAKNTFLNLEKKANAIVDIL